MPDSPEAHRGLLDAPVVRIGRRNAFQSRDVREIEYLLQECWAAVPPPFWAAELLLVDRHQE